MNRSHYHAGDLAFAIILVIISGFLMGPLGMIIAVPSYTVIKVILKQSKVDKN